MKICNGQRGVTEDIDTRQKELRSSTIQALSDCFHAYSDPLSISCWGGAMNQLALSLKPYLKEEEQEQKLKLLGGEEYSENCQKNLSAMLKNPDSLNLKEQIKLILRDNPEFDEHDVLKAIYPAIRPILLEKKKENYPDCSLFMHSVSLSKSGFDDNVEYINIPEEFRAFIKEIGEQRNKRCRYS